MKNLKSKKQFREVHRLRFSATLSNGLNAINSMLKFLTIKKRKLFCSEFLYCSKSLLQSIAIIELKSRYFHV